MDSTNLLPSSSSRNEISIMVQSERAKFLSTYLPHQFWSLPDSIIYYISKNPSNSKCYQKLIQSCKYFFVKNPILVVSKVFLNYTQNEWKAMLNTDICEMKNFTSKIWIENRFDILRGCPHKLLSTFFTKIYQNDLKYLRISMQKIYFTDFIYLASKCDQIFLDGVTIIYDENESTVELENIFKVLPKVNYFKYHLNNDNTTIITSKTIEKLLKIPHFYNLYSFQLIDIPEVFDVDAFYVHIKKNKKTNIIVSFGPQISDEYKNNRLQIIVNEIIATKNRDFKPPFIHFHGMESSSFQQLWMLYCQN